MEFLAHITNSIDKHYAQALELEMSDDYVTKVANWSGNQSQSEGPLIGISPETMLDTVLEVPGQLQLP